MKVSARRSNPHLFPGQGKGTVILTMLIGILVSGNFALAKTVVVGGTPPFLVFFWQLFGASIFLMGVTAMRKQRLSLLPCHIRYYLIGGFLGVSAPQIIAYTVLQHVSNGLFVVLVTLSPLMTFVLTSLFEMRMLPFHRLIGVLVGLIGVSIETMAGIEVAATSPIWIFFAFGVPFLLGITNIYRSKAYPADAHPLSLATGTLLSQTIFLSPVLMIWWPAGITSVSLGRAGYSILALAGITAISYILTFVLQKRTDGVGFSQVGYFVTISGVLIGAAVFGEPIGFSRVGSVGLLFLGLSITNGQITFCKVRDVKLP